MRSHKAEPWRRVTVALTATVPLALAFRRRRRRRGRAARAGNVKGCKDGISSEVRRAVFERDGERCTFESPDGQRCPATTFLELDHVDARAKGGPHTVENLRVRCYPHNKLHAEKTFGREHVEERIHFRQRTSRRVKATEADDTTIELARSGLVNLGYRDEEARRALAIVRDRHTSDVLTPDVVLREALLVLAS